MLVKEVLVHAAACGPACSVLDMRDVVVKVHCEALRVTEVTHSNA